MTLDSAVTRQVLQALQPANVELSVQASRQVEQERTQLNKLWQQQLERATTEAERAGQHYRLVEPEKRLVSRQLAKEWDEKLAVHQQIQEDYQRFCAQQSLHLSENEYCAIQQLAQDIPALWEAATTTNVRRKEILRQLLGRIIVQAQGQSEQVNLLIEWTGGTQTEHLAVRPVASFEQLSYYPQLCQRIQLLVEQEFDAISIANQLNQEGFCTPRLQAGFTRHGVLDLMRRLGVHQRRPTGYNQEPLADGEWWIPDLARQIGIPDTTLYGWLRQGWLEGRKQKKPPYRWIVYADEAEIERLKQGRQFPLSNRIRQQWLGEKSLLAPEHSSEQP